MSKPKRFVTISDVHGNHHDPKAIELALQFTKDFNPDYRIINGDLFDFAALRMGASDVDKMEELNDDVDQAIEIASKFFKKDKVNVFLMGNHDFRLTNMMKKGNNAKSRYFAEMLWEHINEKLLKKYDVIVKPYCAREGVFTLGHLVFVHGYATGAYAAKHHADAYGNVVFGHTHAITSIRSASKKESIGFNQGCLCRLDLSYATKNLGILKWQHGFGYGEVNPDNNFFHYQQATIVDGTLHAATKFKLYE